MLGHDPVLIAGSDEPLAKSVRGARTRWNKWPPVRHEISSVALVQSSPAVLSFAHDPDLVLHLVGTHHGYGRPFPPIREGRLPAAADGSRSAERWPGSGSALPTADGGLDVSEGDSRSSAHERDVGSFRDTARP